MNEKKIQYARGRIWKKPAWMMTSQMVKFSGSSEPAVFLFAQLCTVSFPGMTHSGPSGSLPSAEVS